MENVVDILHDIVDIRNEQTENIDIMNKKIYRIMLEIEQINGVSITKKLIVVTYFNPPPMLLEVRTKLILLDHSKLISTFRLAPFKLFATI